MDEPTPDLQAPDLWLVLDDVHPSLGQRGLGPGSRWPIPPGSRLTVGVRAVDHIQLPRPRDALLGGQTAYVLVRRDDDRVEVQHTGHIGHFRLGGRILNNTVHPPPALAPGEAVDLLTVDGELALRLRLQAGT
ncbi:hypothetical protein SAMN02745121_04724 [Nannocystis exedens]|uniref:Uncharacterized protein n=1 Tax=Nannocystis exedens TaxID=54 RepID=A0A1I2BL13_9BACT|nr:hypothetical protein [Nannocystis exedens]PCC67933.1 hypothetical protein NAEX_00941 [Nannocystis exedens]SFE56488.1 hypothetical protein SAMN02745121_04724 [Nannocystis exedens]